MAKRLKRLMDSEQLSYQRFGEIAGVSAQAVMKWLKGGDVKEANVEKLARHYKVTPLWIRYGEETARQAAAAAKQDQSSYDLLSPIAIDVAAKWMALSADRQESFRDMIFTTHWMERRFPVMKKGRPKGEHYDALEAAIEKDFTQLRLKLE